MFNPNNSKKLIQELDEALENGKNRNLIDSLKESLFNEAVGLEDGERMDGTKCVKDEEMAFFIYKKLAGLGHYFALDVWINYLHDEVSNKDLDQEEAMMFYVRASSIGVARASFFIGEKFEERNSYEMALAYYNLAKLQSPGGHEIMSLFAAANIFLKAGYKEKALNLLKFISKVDIAQSKYIQAHQHEIIEHYQDIQLQCVMLLSQIEAEASIAGSTVAQYQHISYNLQSIQTLYVQADDEYLKSQGMQPVDPINPYHPEGDNVLGYMQIVPGNFYILNCLSHNCPHWVVAYVSNHNVLHIFDGNAAATIMNSLEIPNYLNLGNIASEYEEGIRIHSMAIQKYIGPNSCGYISRYMAELFKTMGIADLLDEGALLERDMEEIALQFVQQEVKENCNKFKADFSLGASTKAQYTDTGSTFQLGLEKIDSKNHAAGKEEELYYKIQADYQDKHGKPMEVLLLKGEKICDQETSELTFNNDTLHDAAG